MTRWICFILCVGCTQRSLPPPSNINKENQHTESILIGTALARTYAAHLHIFECWLGRSLEAHVQIDAKQAFLEGVRAPNLDPDLEAALESYHHYLMSTLSDPILQDKISFSNQFLARKQTEPGTVTLIPNRLCYQTLQIGDGPLLNPHHYQWTLSVVVKDAKDRILSGTYQLLDPLTCKNSDCIPGMILGMTGMHLHERRAISIHPELAYGLFSGIGHGHPLVIEVELVAFTEISPLLPSFSIPVDLHPSLPLDFEDVIRTYMTFCGYKAWHFYQQAFPQLSLEEILPMIRSDQNAPNVEALDHLLWRSV